MMRNHRSGGGGRKGAAQQPWTEQALIMQMNVLKSLLQQQLVDPKHLSAQCLLLSKILDSLVANKRTPVWRHELLPIIKQVCRHRESPELRPALLLLLLSVKNAYRVEWLPSGTGTERDEIFITLKALFDSFTTVHEGADNAPATHLQCGGAAANDIHEVKAYLDVISSRFYPRLQVKSVFVAIQAKVGYEVLMCDFHVSHMSLQDRVRLYVGQKDHTETSTCIITPPQVNFLVNGQQVERRVATGYLDAGAQMPSDITTLVRVGANVLQVIGEFAVSYFVAVTSSTNFGHSSKPTQLEEYVAPTGDEAMEVDDEVVEGASRVSLRCPISHQRLVTPVKASSCRHLQCFDYDSFLEINEKRPAWRCPCCNRLISCPDLRIDRQMEKVLRETDEKVYEVMLYQDGTWVPVATGGGEVQSPDVAEGGGVKPDDIIDLDSYVENERRRSDALFEPQQHDRKPDAQTLQALRNAPVISVPEFTPVQAPVQAPPQQQSSPAVTAEMQPTLLPAINHNFQVTFAQSHLSPGSSSRSTNPSRAYIPSAQLQPPPQTGASPSNPAQGEMRWRQAEQQRQQAVSEMRPQWRSTGAAQHTVPQPQPQQQQQQQQQFFSNQHAANAALQQRSAQQAPARTAGNWSTTTVHQWRTSTSAAQVATMNAAAAAAATTTTTMNAAAAAAASDQHWRPVQRMRGSITNPPGARAQPPRGPVQSYGFSTTNAAPTFSYYGMDPIPVVGTPTNGAAAAAAANVSLYNGSTWVNGANFSSAPLLFSGVQTSDGWLSFDALNSGAPSSSSLR